MVSLLTFPLGNNPSDLIIDDSGSNLYFSDGSWSKAVYSMSISDTKLPSDPLRRVQDQVMLFQQQVTKTLKLPVK